MRNDLVLSERYRVIEKIGEGAFGQVWRALDTILEREVAVKFLHLHVVTSQLSQFRREARSLACLPSSDATIALFDIGEYQAENAGAHTSQPYLVMEYVGGALTLKRWLTSTAAAQGADVTMHQIREVIFGLVRGLAHIHDHQILHRDLKPGNVLIQERGGRLQARISDFGLARSSHNVENSLNAGIAGTPGFMAPEQIKVSAENPIGRHTDIYSLGAVLYWMFEGREPHGDRLSGGGQERMFALLHATVHDDVPELSDDRESRLPGLRRLLASMLNRDPVLRPTLTNVAADLKRILAAEPEDIVNISLHRSAASGLTRLADDTVPNPLPPPALLALVDQLRSTVALARTMVSVTAWNLCMQKDLQQTLGPGPRAALICDALSRDFEQSFTAGGLCACWGVPVPALTTSAPIWSVAVFLAPEQFACGEKKWPDLHLFWRRCHAAHVGNGRSIPGTGTFAHDAKLLLESHAGWRNEADVPVCTLRLDPAIAAEAEVDWWGPYSAKHIAPILAVGQAGRRQRLLRGLVVVSSESGPPVDSDSEAETVSLLAQDLSFLETTMRHGRMLIFAKFLAAQLAANISFSGATNHALLRHVGSARGTA